MKEKTGFLEEGPGIKSNTRLIATAVVANAIFLADLIIIWWLITTKDLSGTIGVVVGMVTTLFTGMTGVVAAWKLIQKPMENNNISIDQKNSEINNNIN